MLKSKKAVWAGWILTIAICIPFIFSASAKLAPQLIFPQMPEQMAAMGLPVTILPLLAGLEIMCIIVYLIPQTSVLGAILFTGYLGGAMLTHLRIGQNVAMHVVFGLIVWAGIYLREPRLHDVLPWRKR